MSSLFRQRSLECIYFAILIIVWIVSSELQMPLKEAASSRGIFMGSECCDNATMLVEQYSLVTPGNACKWPLTEPANNVFNFTDCDYLFHFAVSNNQTFRGHNLCWGQDNPEWLLKGNYDSQQLKAILQTHIHTVMAHYKANYTGIGGFYAWDVVNEAINDPPFLNESAQFKSNVWYPSVPNYVEVAFAAAGEIAQGTEVKLFYNDFNITLDTGYTKQKSDAVYALLKGMLSKGIRVDGIGFESHMNMGEYESITNGYDSIVRNFQRFADLGLEIHITEMDVMCGEYVNGVLIPCSNFTNSVAQKQAQMYGTMLRACLAIDECKSFETWGFSDRNSWRGSKEYPLPFDYNYEPKCAAYYIENLLLNISNNGCPFEAVHNNEEMTSVSSAKQIPTRC